MGTDRYPAEAGIIIEQKLTKGTKSPRSWRAEVGRSEGLQPVRRVNHDWTRNENEAWVGPRIRTGVNAEVAEYAEEAERRRGRGAGGVGDRGSEIGDRRSREVNHR